MKPTVQILLYTGREKLNGKYPVKVRVVYQRQHRDFKIGLDMTKDEFTEASKPKPSKAYIKAAAELTSWKEKANKAVEALPQFTFDKFQAMIFGKHKDASDIYPFFDDYIKKIYSEDRIKTASSYQTAMNTIKRFHGKSKLSIYDITPQFLNNFHKWMLDQNNSPTTVGIYTRTLRAVYNYCISLGVIKRDETYPFGRNRFIIPAGRNIKKALSLAEIKKIYDYKPIEGTYEDRSKDLWMFSYYCNGLNFRDLAKLKFKNIDGDMLRFIREKTKKTSQGNQQVISCFLTQEAKEIIIKWGNEDVKLDNYIFPILDIDDSPLNQSLKIDQLIQTTNKNMKRICEYLELGKVATTYFSRHSAATILKRSGASIGQIQEALGHSNSIVTQKYLDSFEDDSKKELAKALTKFE